jgi:hypothetical protein
MVLYGPTKYITYILYLEYHSVCPLVGIREKHSTLESLLCVWSHLGNTEEANTGYVVF